MKAIIVGQAPSRRGDGMPFGGPSGARLCRLVGVDNREELKQLFHLTNLIRHPLDQHPQGRGDKFDHAEATKRGQDMMTSAQDGQVFIACGRQVWRCLTGNASGPFYSMREVVIKTKRATRRIKVYLFPHPSGASGVWNYPAEVRRASSFLKSMIEEPSPDQSMIASSSSSQLSRPLLSMPDGPIELDASFAGCEADS